MITPITPSYGYMPANTEYTAFWRNHDKQFARKLAIRAQDRALTDRNSGNQNRKGK